MISILCPCFNEEEVIPVFFERIFAVIDEIPENFEIVCVNDGSRDRTLEVLKEYALKDERIKVIDLSRNFGKEAALTANSYGWDDEFFNLEHLEQCESLLQVITHFNNIDLHPVGQYVMNYLLYAVLGSWQSVRAAGALIVALSLWLYWYFTRRQKLSYILLCLNPSMLLWCTGLRWYTYIIPLACGLGLVMHKSSDNISGTKRITFWVCYFVLCVLMFHVAYCSIIMILASFFCILYTRREHLRSEAKIILTLTVISSLLISYQAYAFLTVHYPTGRGKLVSMLMPFISAGQNYLCGSAVVPVSLSGILFISAGMVIFIAYIMNIRSVMKECTSKYFVLSYLANIILKTGVGARYYTVINPQQADFMNEAYSCIRNRRIRISVLCLYFAGSILGLFSVITHTDTAKASWNTPYESIIAYITNADPQKELLTITSNPVLCWHMKELGYNAIDLNKHELPKDEGMIFAVKTFRGTLNPKRNDEYVSFIETHEAKEHKFFGYDKYAGFKRRIDKAYPDYPDYYAEVFMIMQ